MVHIVLMVLGLLCVFSLLGLFMQEDGDKRNTTSVFLLAVSMLLFHFSEIVNLPVVLLAALPVLIIVLILGLIKPSLVIRWNENKSRGNVLKYYGFLIGVFFIVMMFTASGTPNNNEAANPKSEIEATNQQNNGQKESTLYSLFNSDSNNVENELAPSEMKIDEYLEDLVNKTVGSKTNEGQKVYMGHEVDKDTIILNLFASENLSKNMTRRGIVMECDDLFVSFFKDRKDYDELLLQWYLTLVDQKGNKKVSKVLLISMNRNNYQSINWDNVYTDVIPNIANDYWVHPALKE